MGRPFADLSVEEQSALRFKRIERLELVIARLMGGEATPEDMGIAHGLRAAYEKKQHPLLEGEVIDGRLHAPRPDGTCSGCNDVFGEFLDHLEAKSNPVPDEGR